MLRNVVFMGTPDFAVGTLQALIDSDRYQVQAVFSQPDKPKGRSGALQMPPVKETAVAAGIPVYQPVKIREPQWLDVLKELRTDVIVVVAFGQIIPQSILDLPEYGCINVHASLLPKYRGAAPIQWAIINGEAESGVTTMRMDAGLDTGDMILRTVVPIEKEETGGSLFDKLSKAGAELLLRTLDALENGTAIFEKQPADSPTLYAAMLKKEDGRIDWTKSARSIECLIRGVDPWPGAWIRFRGKLLKIWKAEVVETAGGQPCTENVLDGNVTQSSLDGDLHVTAAKNITDTAARPGGNGNTLKKTAGDAASVEEKALERMDGNDADDKSEAVRPGMVCAVTKKSLYVQTGDGVLSILELQPEGKKRMPVDAFLRGYPVGVGDPLGL